MISARGRKHYRTVQKRIEKEKGLFIPEDKKPMVVILSVAVALMAFINGILVGYAIFKKD